MTVTELQVLCDSLSRYITCLHWTCLEASSLNMMWAYSTVWSRDHFTNSDPKCHKIRYLQQNLLKASKLKVLMMASVTFILWNSWIIIILRLWWTFWQMRSDRSLWGLWCLQMTMWFEVRVGTRWKRTWWRGGKLVEVRLHVCEWELDRKGKVARRCSGGEFKYHAKQHIEHKKGEEEGVSRVEWMETSVRVVSGRIIAARVKVYKIVLRPAMIYVLKTVALIKRQEAWAGGGRFEDVKIFTKRDQNGQD